MRIAVLFDNFGPYHVARLTAAARKMDVLGVELHSRSSFYNWESPDVPTALQRVCLMPPNRSRGIDWNELTRLLDEHVGTFKPDIVAVPGWSAKAEICMAHWAARRKIPCIVMSASNRMDFKRWALIEFAKKSFLKQFSAALCGSELQKAYLTSLGLDPSSVFFGYDVVDNNYFAAGAKKARKKKIMPQLKDGAKLEERWFGRYFLTSARFIEKKNLLQLLDAYGIYRAAVQRGEEAWPLVILGDGDLRPQIEAKCCVLDLQDVVHLPGFRQYDELPQFYGTAGVFILASKTEQWGLVVNEAMASGLPVLVSDRCGCSQTLVEPGANGFTFDFDDIFSLAGLMQHMAGECDLQKMSKVSSRIISNWGTERFARGLFDAVEFAKHSGSNGTSLPGSILAHVLAEIQSRRS